MAKGFDILTRKHLLKENYDIDSSLLSSTKDKFYNLPLRVFSAHQGPIPVGTVVGIVLKSKESRSVPFVPNIIHSEIKLIPEQSGPNDGECIVYEQKYFRYFPVYEHFFRIIKNRNDTTYALKPVYLDGGKVLKKGFDCEFNSIIWINTSFVKNHEFVIEQYLQKYGGSGKHDIDLDDNYVSASKVKSFLEIIAQNEINVEQLRKTMPFEHYKNLVTPSDSDLSVDSRISNFDCPLFRFYEGFEKHKERLCQLLDSNEIEAIGSWEKVLENSISLYKEACDAIGEKIEIPIHYKAFDFEKLCESDLDVSGLKTVSKNSIFRVYLPDPNYCLRPAIGLGDWCGKRLPEAILRFLQPGNIIRYIAGKVDDESYWSKDYARILYKIDHQRYLVAREDQYLVVDENINFVLDVGAIIEIPLEWDGNENLQVALSSLTPPEDFDSESEDSTSFNSQLRNECKTKDISVFIEFNYDSLNWT